MKLYEYRTHIVALLVAILGPLVTIMLRVTYTMPSIEMYLYWTLCLSIYIAILIPFAYKSPLTLLRLIILGIVVEDFASHAWRSLILGDKFLPFCNWYTQHFQFLGSLGEPTPLILIPRWYVLALLIYFVITIIQFRKKFMVKKTKKGMFIVLIILFFLLVFFLSIQNPEPQEKLLILGSNLGVWGVKGPGEIDEPFVLNLVQRELARGVIGTFRMGTDCQGELCVNGLIPDSMLLDLLDKIEKVDAEPFVVLSLTNDWKAKHIVGLFKGRVKYYEFGNEPGWTYGPAENYTKRWNEIVPQLKTIDPNIKIGGPVDGGCNEWGQNYIRTFLELANPKPDFVSWHMYAGKNSDNNSEIINKTSQWSECIDTVEKDIIITTVGHSLPIVISEWNWNAMPEYENDFRDQDEQFMWNFTSTAIEEFKNNKYLLMAHQFCYGAHCANGHLAMIAGEWPYSDPKPQYDVFLHYAKIFCPECPRESLK